MVRAMHHEVVCEARLYVKPAGAFQAVPVSIADGTAQEMIDHREEVVPRALAWQPEPLLRRERRC